MLNVWVGGSRHTTGTHTNCTYVLCLFGVYKHFARRALPCTPAWVPRNTTAAAANKTEDSAISSDNHVVKIRLVTDEPGFSPNRSKAWCLSKYGKPKIAGGTRTACGIGRENDSRGFCWLLDMQRRCMVFGWIGGSKGRSWIVFRSFFLSLVQIIRRRKAFGPPHIQVLTISKFSIGGHAAGVFNSAHARL